MELMGKWWWRVRLVTQRNALGTGLGARLDSSPREQNKAMRRARMKRGGGTLLMMQSRGPREKATNDTATLSLSSTTRETNQRFRKSLEDEGWCPADWEEKRRDDPICLAPFPFRWWAGSGAANFVSVFSGCSRIRVNPAAEFRLIHLGCSSLWRNSRAPAAAAVAAGAMQRDRGREREIEASPTTTREERKRSETDWSTNATLV